MWTGLTPDVICVNTKVHSVTGEPSQSSSKLFIYIYIYIYIFIYIYINLPVNVIVRLPHPRSRDSQGHETFQNPLLTSKPATMTHIYI